MHDAERVAAQAVERHRREPSQLLQILVETQDAVGYLPAASLTRIADLLDLPRSRVEGGAGFYSFLYTEPVGASGFSFPTTSSTGCLAAVR